MTFSSFFPRKTFSVTQWPTLVPGVRRAVLCIVLVWLLPFPAVFSVRAADLFALEVQPYLKKYCIECHNHDQAKGELDLTRFSSAADVVANFRRWHNIVEFIHNGEMPPKDAVQPAITDSNAVVDRINAILAAEAKKQAGDPGTVLPRRLSNAEYDNSIRDLTGIEIQATKDFPPDPAGGEGFDNTGESLGMTPNLLKKYLAAAQLVSEHLVLKTTGIAFAPFPVMSYNERKKLTEQAIIDFYEAHSVNVVAYLEAAWRYRYRTDEQQKLSLKQWAASRKLSPSYLTRVWEFLNSPASSSKFFQEIGQRWQALPAPPSETQHVAEIPALAAAINRQRRLLSLPEPALIQSNAGNWPISHLAFRAKIAASRDTFDSAALKDSVLLNAFRVSASNDTGKSPPTVSVYLRIEPVFADRDSYVIIKRPLFSKQDHLPNNDRDEEQQGIRTLRSALEQFNPEHSSALNFGKHPLGESLDEDSFVVKAPALVEIPLSPAIQQELDGKNLLIPCQLDRTQGAEGCVVITTSKGEPPTESKGSLRTELLLNRGSETAKQLAVPATAFCATFPDRFFYVDSGRGLAAGFHLVEGFFRDDRPLVEKVLDEVQRAALDQLWLELDFVTQSAETLLRGFVWFERSEREVLHDKRFDFLRAEDPTLISEEMLTKFEKLYLDKMGVKRRGDALEPESPDEKFGMIHGFFESIRQGLRLQESLAKQAEAAGLTNLEQVARRAFRRELELQDRQALNSLYKRLRSDGLDIESALRGVMQAILMSPDFCYLYSPAPEGKQFYPLSNEKLASRLSYFLWSSLPDEDLLKAATSGKLQEEQELIRQTDRMLKDDRVESFAQEFLGQWLRYRDYLSKDPIHAEAFPSYDTSLRQSIFDEPARLATHLIQTDQPITQLLTSDVTFVNDRLAKHYGGEIERQYHSQLQRRTDNAKLKQPGNGTSQESPWYPVTGLRRAGRGGLFGMAIILTKNSAGERTSPVKRGFWSVHHLLGQHFPPPPADVPELPTSEKKAERTIRELLASHVEASQCAMCHKHFDSLGLAMEGFDAIGRTRTVDSAGRVVDNRAQLPHGEMATGIEGLIEYVDKQRRQDFIRTLCRKFLGYALGRSVILSDQPLLDEMESELEQHDYRFSVLFHSVIRSRQFREQRGRDFSSIGS